ncbi:MAG: flagellin [Lachnospiraceae bacterium]|nr:flagellin [Lachnospiraceae bacterium]MCI9545635.1 flagellin [Lachnospiraceae bacterium]
MKIQHNIKALNSHKSLRTNNNLEKKNLEKLASGYRINRAADDAAGLNISEEMRAQVTGLDQAFDNAQDGISLVRTMEGAMEEAHCMLNRMVELSVQAAHGIYSEENRGSIQEEVDQLRDEMQRIEDTTKFNGIALFKGGESLTLQISESSEASGQLKVELPDLSAANLGIKDISVETAEQAREALSKIEWAVDYVSQARGKVGAYYNRLECTSNNLNEMSSNISASESRIRDVNMAKEEMRRVKNDIFGESAQAMLAQANQVPEGILPLLQQ